MATIRRRFHISAQLYPAISGSSELARESVVLGLGMRIPADTAEKTDDCCKPDPRELRTDHRKGGSVTHDRSPADLDRRSCSSTLLPLSPEPQPACLGHALPRKEDQQGLTLCVEEHTSCSYISVTLFLFFFPSRGFLQVKTVLPVCHNTALMTFSFKRTSLNTGPHAEALPGKGAGNGCLCPQTTRRKHLSVPSTHCQ